MSVALAISKERGQPGTVRIGTITSIDPMVVNVQGTQFTGAGFLDEYEPVVGHTVAVLGQSAVTADGSSWLVLGRPMSAGTPSMLDVNVLAFNTGEGSSDFGPYVVADGELDTGLILVDVPIIEDRLIGLHFSFCHSNDVGVAGVTRLRIREDDITGAVMAQRDFLAGPGNTFYAGRMDAYFFASSTREQTYIATVELLLSGEGVFRFTDGDVFMARDYGPRSREQTP